MFIHICSNFKLNLYLLSVWSIRVVSEWPSDRRRRRRAAGGRPLPLDGGRRRARDQGVRGRPEPADDALHSVVSTPGETARHAQDDDGLPQDRLSLQTRRALLLFLQQWTSKSEVFMSVADCMHYI